MGRTIFSKLILSFIAVLLTAFLITGGILYYFLTDFVLDEKIDLMEENGEYVKSLLTRTIDNNEQLLAVFYLRSALAYYRTNNQMLVWIIASDGRVAITENIDSEYGIPTDIQNKMEQKSGSFYLPDERQYKKVMEGATESVIEKGDFYGLFELTDIPWIVIQKPVFYNNEVIGAVFLSTPIPEVQKARTSVFDFFMISMGFSVIISIILMYIFSLRITRPLKKINDAAKIIAAGEFSDRLDIKSRDEIGQLANTFNQMASELQNLENLRRAFIANVSHELRTPITSIKGFVEGILDGTIPSEKQNYYLSIVKDEGSRLGRLVNDLLQLARIEAGEYRPEYKNFDINELIRLTIIKLESFILNKNIEVEAIFEDEKTIVHADPDAIERVLFNLIHNAIKFSRDAGKITIETSIKKDRVYISVGDNGPGIAEEELNRIWDRFYKSDKSRGMDKTGTGLGLAIVKNLLNEHHQQINVQSIPEVGTTFTFSLEKEKKQ